MNKMFKKQFFPRTASALVLVTAGAANAASVAIDSTAAKPDRSHFLCRVRAEARPA